MKWKDIMFSVFFLAGIVALPGMVSPEVYSALLSDRPLAMVRRYKPAVDIFNAPKKLKAERGEPLYSGDTLETDKNGYAAVQFMNKSIAKVKPQSRLVVTGEVTSTTRSFIDVLMEAGEIFLNVAKQADQTFKVSTSNSVAAVKGTQFGATSDSYFWVKEGVVELTALESGDTVTLKSNMYGQVSEDGTGITTGQLSENQLKELEQGYDNLDKKLIPKIIKLIFRDQNGQRREIEIEYFEN